MVPAHFHCDRMQKQQALVMWIIWFVFLQMAFAYHFVLERWVSDGRQCRGADGELAVGAVLVADYPRDNSALVGDP